jgi:hypothetical protein
MSCRYVDSFGAGPGWKCFGYQNGIIIILLAQIVNLQKKKCKVS